MQDVEKRWKVEMYLWRRQVVPAPHQKWNMDRISISGRMDWTAGRWGLVNQVYCVSRTSRLSSFISVIIKIIKNKKVKYYFDPNILSKYYF